MNSSPATPCTGLHPHPHCCSEGSFFMLGKKAAASRHSVWFWSCHTMAALGFSVTSLMTPVELMVNKCRTHTLASSKTVRSFHTIHDTMLCLLCIEPCTSSRFLFQRVPLRGLCCSYCQTVFVQTTSGIRHVVATLKLKVSGSLSYSSQKAPWPLCRVDQLFSPQKPSSIIVLKGRQPEAICLQS